MFVLTSRTVSLIESPMASKPRGVSPMPMPMNPLKFKFPKCPSTEYHRTFRPFWVPKTINKDYLDSSGLEGEVEGLGFVSQQPPLETLPRDLET